jgi:glutathione S-transferase
MALKVYGALQSRAFRTLWMVEELGVPYEHEPVLPRDARTASYLAVNPNGHVPAIVDDGLTLVESMAINLYLAAKYRALWPGDVRGQGLAYQWSFWAMTELEADLLTALRHRTMLPEDERDEALAAAAEERLQKPLAVLNRALEGRDHLAGDEFTVADLNVAAVLSWARGGRVSLDSYPDVARWYAACFARPARKAASSK